MSKFERLFNPRSIAIVGATEDISKPGSQTVRALNEYGYRGKIFPVNPKYQQLERLRCFSSLGEISSVIDVVVIAVPAPNVAAIIKSCGNIGIPYAVVLGAGFSESGPEGAKLQNQLIADARENGVRVLGPNCLGLANIHDRVFAAFGSLVRPPLLAPGPLSMVTQSGGFGSSLSTSCRAAGIGFRLLIATGNDADLNTPEIIDALIDDPATEIILCYLEGVNDGRTLLAAGARALAAGKPILIWKAGNTRHGVSVAASHTANMTGSYDVWRAALRQCGIIEVRDIGEVVDFIKALLAKRFPRGRHVTVISPSGGTAVVFSDAVDKYGLALPKLNVETAAAIRKALPHAASLNNPIDLGSGALGAHHKERTLQVMKLLLSDSDTHQLCVLFPVTMGERAEASYAALAAAAKLSDKPVIIFSSVLREADPKSFELLDRANIPVLRSPLRVARAMSMLADYAQIRAMHLNRRKCTSYVSPAAPPIAARQGARDEKGILNEAASKAFVAECGIAVTRDVVLPVNDDSAVDSCDIGFPAAVKVLAADIPHKTDAGGVVLNVANREALRVAAGVVVRNARQAHPSARIDGVLVSEMIVDAVEVIVGIVNDSVFGPVILLGIGGVLAEAMHDVAYRVAPFDLTEAQSMIGALRARRIFDGMRGKPPCDVNALAESLVGLSRLAWSERARIAELDINPLMVRPNGFGVVAADALVVMR